MGYFGNSKRAKGIPRIAVESPPFYAFVADIRPKMAVLGIFPAQSYFLGGKSPQEIAMKIK